MISSGLAASLPKDVTETPITLRRLYLGYLEPFFPVLSAGLFLKQMEFLLGGEFKFSSKKKFLK